MYFQQVDALAFSNGRLPTAQCAILNRLNCVADQREPYVSLNAVHILGIQGVSFSKLQQFFCFIIEKTCRIYLCSQTFTDIYSCLHPTAFKIILKMDFATSMIGLVTVFIMVQSVFKVWSLTLIVITFMNKCISAYML